MELKHNPQQGEEYWKLLKDVTEESFKQVFPVNGRVNQIRLDKIEFRGDDKLHSHDFHSQEQAKQARQAIQHAALISAWCYYSFLDEATPENMGVTA